MQRHTLTCFETETGPRGLQPNDSTSIRAPRVGDVGTVVSVRSSSHGGDTVALEKLSEGDETVWFAEFSPDELALMRT
jgi:hypothetical protein